MKHFTLLLAAFFCTIHLSFSQQYNYAVNLREVSKDRVKVTCKLPKVTTERIDFIFPNVIPGSYALKEYGRYITNFKAYDANGKKLKVRKADKYNYSIEQAQSLDRIEYSVNDSWEETNGKRFIFQPGGTNIDAGKNFVINHYGFFGYIDGYKNLPFEITFSKPTFLKGYCYLPVVAADSVTDVVRAKGYDLLADNPILYCKPNEFSFKAGDSKIDICVYSENDKVNASQLAEIVKPVAGALEKFFGVLPVDRYLFMFYLADASKVPQRKGKGLGSGFGALEHNNCSFYFMPEYDNKTSSYKSLQDVCSHEFLHILTPLNVHSKEIEDFNFRVPVMSKHLWMYEGVTEYFSNLALMQDTVMSEKNFMKEMRRKMAQSAEYGTFSMTEMSRNVITQENQARYRSVYNRGALLAMMLDILIIDRTDGSSSLKTVMMQLAKKYGPDKPFDDDVLLDEIVALTHAEVKTFFERHITGTEMPDYAPYLNLIGYDYTGEKKSEVYYIGSFGLKYDFEKSKFVFYREGLNTAGIENDDVLIAINNEEVNADNFDNMFEEHFNGSYINKEISISILRNGKKLLLKAIPQKATKTERFVITPQLTPATKALQNFKTFSGRSFTE